MKGDDRVIAFDIKNNVKEAEPKATKREFAYVEEKENPRCGNCNMYLIGEKCTLVKGKIDPDNGDCNYWAYRRTQPPTTSTYEPSLTKEAAGYVEAKGGTRCGTCEYSFSKDLCKKVHGKINFQRGCCIRWEKK